MLNSPYSLANKYYREHYREHHREHYRQHYRDNIEGTIESTIDTLDLHHRVDYKQYSNDYRVPI